MKAVYIEQTGSPDLLRFGEQPAPQPAAGEALVHAAAGADEVILYDDTDFAAEAKRVDNRIELREDFKQQPLLVNL